MKKWMALFGSVAALALANTDVMAAPQGWYLGVGAGWTTIDPVRFNLGAPAGPASGKDSFGDSAAVNFTMGVKFASHLRAEAELQYADFDAKNLKGTGLPQSSLKGDAGATSFLVNLLYDLPLSRHFAFTLGGGIGAAQFDPSITDAALNRIHGSQTEFTWQGIAGMTIALSDRIEVQADYRYQSIGSSDHTFNGLASSPFTYKDKDIQSVMLSLRWYLSGPAKVEAPPPPPPPPPPPQPPPAPPPPVKTFIVFFDFNKSDLTEAAQQVVAEAVKTAKETGAVRVLITGHTDTVGSQSYNQTLSEKRATAVKAQMIADGLADNEISTLGRGFNDPLIPTGPNVKEPQNRRAVIDLAS